MGAFYGSIHVRTADRANVLAAAEKLARKDTRLLIGPALRGWVALYPSGNGQDERLGRLLAKRVPGDVIQVIVHDDDIFAYCYYRDGKLIDRYNSRPDYFGAVSDREKAKVRGRPEKLAHLLVDPARAETLRQLLSPEEARATTFAGATLSRFAGLLGLANAETAYEYLMEEDADDIERRDEFFHVPDLSAEEAEKIAEEARQAQVRQRWRDEGLLRVEEGRPTKGGSGLMPYVCPDGASGFVVCWTDCRTQNRFALQHYQPPWSLPAKPTGIDLESTVHRVKSSRSGRYLAVGHAAGDWNARLWDLASRQKVLEVAHARVVNWVGISPDEKLLVTVGEEDCYVTSIETGERVSAPAIRQGEAAAVHPGGTLVVGDEKGRLHFIDVRTGAIQRTLTIGNREGVEAKRQLHLAALRRAYAGMDAGAFEQSLQEQTRQVDQTVRQMIDGLGMGQGNSEDWSMQFKAQLLKNIEECRAFEARQRREVETGQVDVGGTEQAFAMSIDRDGRWLCLGTTGGVRVYAWDALSAATDYLSDPAFRVDSHTIETGYSYCPAYVYDLALHEAEQNLVFGGLAGRIESLDLETGRHRILLSLPGDAVIHRVSLASDAAHLACSVQPAFHARGRDQKPPELHIWDYAELMRRAK
jgi:hypothetical protein